jgi:hypothetical protein
LACNRIVLDAATPQVGPRPPIGVLVNGVVRMC